MYQFRSRRWPAQSVWPDAGQAEAAPAENGFTDPSIRPTPEGWSGRALQPGVYEVNLTVGKDGAITVKR
jgi:hypothetical protein